MLARSHQISVVPISYRYTTIHDLQPNSQERKIIEAGDMVYVYIESLLSNEVIDEIMYISEVSISYAKNNLNITAKLVSPEYYRNPSVRPRKQLIKQRKLSSI